MLSSYKKVLEMKLETVNKIEEETKILIKIENTLYVKKESIINKIIDYLKSEMDIEYFSYKIIDLNGNNAEALIRKDSDIFINNIKQKQVINFNLEELIDIRRFENLDEIIILDIDSKKDIINLEYLCLSLEYKFLSYSEDLKNNLRVFLEYIMNRQLEKINRIN